VLCMKTDFEKQIVFRAKSPSKKFLNQEWGL